MRTVLHKSVRDMNEHIIVALRPQNIFAIRLGVRRRRSWSDAAKGRIVAESFALGAVVSQVFAWRVSLTSARRLGTV